MKFTSHSNQKVLIFIVAYNAENTIIDVLNKRYGLEIDVNPLIEEGKEIKAKMMELAEKAQQYQQQQLPSTEKEGYTRYYQ